MRVLNPDVDLQQFFRRLASTRVRVLMLDYDGTMAPFRVERDQARPDPELHQALQNILNAGRSRVVLISGRAIADLIPLLGMDPLPEIWGCHGWERRFADGAYETVELNPKSARALGLAHDWIAEHSLEPCCETKPASVALHWRGLGVDVARSLESAARAAWQPLADSHALELHAFDGGLELRAAGRHKGTVVDQILSECDLGVAAYAGDDRTDEDAFRGLSGHGLSILVRDELRPTAADIWLTPRELLEFLNEWHAAERRTG